MLVLHAGLVSLHWLDLRFCLRALVFDWCWFWLTLALVWLDTVFGLLRPVVGLV